MSITVKESMTDIAYHCMTKRKKEVEFARLWQEVSRTLKVPEEKLDRKKAQFYNELMLDSRFASLKGNKWDLRDRRKFEEVHKDTASLLDNDDEIEEREDEEEMESIGGSEEGANVRHRVYSASGSVLSPRPFFPSF